MLQPFDNEALRLDKILKIGMWNMLINEVTCSERADIQVEDSDITVGKVERTIDLELFFLNYDFQPKQEDIFEVSADTEVNMVTINEHLYTVSSINFLPNSDFMSVSLLQ